MVNDVKHDHKLVNMAKKKVLSRTIGLIHLWGFGDIHVVVHDRLIDSV